MRRLVVLSIAAAVGIWAPCASAAEDLAPGDIARRGRAFFDADMAYWQGTVGDPRSTTQAVLKTETVGILGYRRVPLGFGLGFAPSERWVIGARLDVAFEPEHDPEHMPFTIRGALGPFAELTFLRDRQVRPFAIVRASLGRSHAFAREGNSADLESVDAVTLYPSAGAGLGTHVFLTDQVSFDAMLVLDHRWNFTRRREAPDATIDDNAIRPEGWSYRDGTLSTALTFGFSHWW